jgi:hypothetical protein
MHNVLMPSVMDHPGAHESGNLWLEKRAHLSRGHRRGEESTAANVTSFMSAIPLTAAPYTGDTQ